MPLALIPPKPGRNKVYRVRGTHFGVYIDRSTKTDSKVHARKFLKAWQEQIERGELSGRGELTFCAAAISYLNAGGDKSISPVLTYFGDKMLASAIDQRAVDNAAAALHPHATPATRNRKVYTPVIAILRHAGLATVIRRPKGANGDQRRIWLKPEQYERVLAAAEKIDLEFSILLTLIAFTGLRRSEALFIRCENIDLGEQAAFVGKTKNGDPRTVYLPPRVVAALANHPRGLDRKGRLFKLSRNNKLYELAAGAFAAAGVDDGGAPFHIFRHTYGAMMTRAGADLVSTGAWRSRQSASVYEHFDANEEARKADLIPGAKRG